MRTSSYTRNSQAPDVVPSDAVDIQYLATEICSADEVHDFLANIPEPPSVTEARWEVIQAYESGAIGAVEAFNALQAYGCLRDVDEVLQAFIFGTRSRLLLGEMPVESPPCHPTAPEPHRAVSPPAKELLDVVAGARMSRGRAA
jgi:hypothetical protein